MNKRILSLALLLTVLAACAPAIPTGSYILGDMLLRDDFSTPRGWLTFVDPAQGVDFRYQDSAFRARITQPVYAWTMNTQPHTDVMLQIDVLQVSTFANNAYGIICRAGADNGGNGYYFLISGEGYFSIRRGVEGEGGGVLALIPWTRSNAIVVGERNTLRAVCAGDYLALYINDQFAGDVRDRYLTHGFTGLAAAVVQEGEVEVLFDNLIIWQVSPQTAAAGATTASPE